MDTMRQIIDKIATTILRFIFPTLALVFPLFFLPITTNFYDYNKNYLIFVFASIAIIAWTLRTISRRRLHVTLAPATMPLLLLAIIYILSSVIQSSTPLISLLGKTSIVVSLVIIFIAVTSSQKNDWVIKSTILSLITSTSIASTLSLLSTNGMLSALTSVSILQDKGFSPTGGPIQYLSLSLIVIPSLIALALKTKRNLFKTLFFILAALNLTASVSTISLLLTSSSKFSWPFLPLAAGWSITIDTFKNIRTALLGTGPENFTSTFTGLRPSFLNASSVWNVRFSSSSNELFTTITTTGLLGGLFFITSLLRTISAAKKIKGTENAPYYSFSRVLLISSLILNLVIPANTILMTTTLIALALVTLSLKLESDVLTRDATLSLVASSGNTTTGDYTQLPKESLSANQILVWLFAIPSFAIVSLFWSLSLPTYAANMATYNALRLINTNSSLSYQEQIKAYTLDPRNPIYRINFAQTSLALANSIASKEKLTDQDKNDISLLVQQAIRESKNATTLDPQNVVVWENLAGIYQQLTNFAEGASDWTIASYNQAITLDPTNPALRLNLGGVFLTMQRLDDSINLFSQAVSLKPDWPNAHYNLSSAYKANKNITKALEQMRIVVQLIDPNSPDYQKAQDELSALEKLAPAAGNNGATGQPTADSPKQNLELVTPTPNPSPATKIDLPENSGPVIPSPTPTAVVTPEASPTPTPTTPIP